MKELNGIPSEKLTALYDKISKPSHGAIHTAGDKYRIPELTLTKVLSNTASDVSPSGTRPQVA